LREHLPRDDVECIVIEDTPPNHCFPLPLDQHHLHEYDIDDNSHSYVNDHFNHENTIMTNDCSNSCTMITTTSSSYPQQVDDLIVEGENSDCHDQQIILPSDCKCLANNNNNNNKAAVSSLFSSVTIDSSTISSAHNIQSQSVATKASSQSFQQQSMSKPIQCPICNQEFISSNTIAINQHIDQCLHGSGEKKAMMTQSKHQVLQTSSSNKKRKLSHNRTADQMSQTKSIINLLKR
jgi:hypothetical protein